MPRPPVKRAAELMDAEFLARWMDREAIGGASRRVLRAIHERLVADGRPIDVVVQDGRVVAACPFATSPTGFVVVLDGS